MSLRALWLVLALWGAVHPMYWFMTYLAGNGWDFGAMIDAWYVNDSTTGLTWDLTIAAIQRTRLRGEQFKPHQLITSGSVQWCAAWANSGGFFCWFQKKIFF